MVAVLSRATHFGMAPETTAGTYVAPTFFVPFDPGSLVIHDNQPPLRDESVRNNDSLLQGLYPGPRSGGFDFTMNMYPVESGHLLRSIIGPDTVTAAPTSTTTSGAITAGTAAITGTVALVPNSVILVDSAGPNPEIRYVVTATTVNQNWAYAHNSGVSVTYLTKHTFQQSATLAQPKTYSATLFDQVQSTSLVYSRLASLGVSIDVMGLLKWKPSYLAFFRAAQSTASPSYSTTQPLLGWQWTSYKAATLAVGGINTSRQMADFTFSRQVDILPGSDGSQDPRELFAGDLAVVGKKVAIYENTGSNTDNDWTDFRDQVQSNPWSAFIASPQGTGSALLITTSKPGVVSFNESWGKKYLEADFSLDGIANTTDVGQVSVTLWNSQSTQYA